MSQTAREINRIEEMGLYCTSNNYAFNNYTFNKTPNSYQNNAGCLKGSLHK